MSLPCFDNRTSLLMGYIYDLALEVIGERITSTLSVLVSLSWSCFQCLSSSDTCASTWMKMLAFPLESLSPLLGGSLSSYSNASSVSPNEIFVYSLIEIRSGDSDRAWLIVSACCRCLGHVGRSRRGWEWA